MKTVVVRTRQIGQASNSAKGKDNLLVEGTTTVLVEVTVEIEVVTGISSSQSYEMLAKTASVNVA